MQMLFGLTLWMLIAFLNAYVAQTRGRDPLAWFMIGVVFNVFSLLALLILPKLEPKSDEQLGEPVDLNAEEETETEKDEDMMTTYASKQWYYADQEYKQQGPVQYKILKGIFLRGDVNHNTFVWYEGMPKWERIKDVPGLEEAMAYD